MTKYRKKPVVIEAIQWSGRDEDMHHIVSFTNGSAFKSDADKGTSFITIPTLEGNHSASSDDYVIKGVKGEFYPCKPDIFHLTYDEVKDNV